MKMIFVDAENIGLKELEKVKATVIDKVFVFSKVESVQRICEKSLFLYLSEALLRNSFSKPSSPT
ncbi:hypothetical protein HPY15_15580 [Vibrio cholerae]|uniref:hypothetical protein n=1 Tax=Vibrio cholerae TaxID=666 RepID=UPI000615B1B9|nr:hypothetical protein [Vibrio cholerae]AKB05854.1 hypothetical protein VAB027_683 [Vibrio cholerae]QKU94240.1 hypothetical protein HPY15_15580 [Vibrio cholerae]GHZ02690.1 hypothetical protein VCSRO27_3581 [Vibrio cholerae]